MISLAIVPIMRSSSEGGRVTGQPGSRWRTAGFLVAVLASVPTPAAGQQPGDVRPEATLRIEALTPLRPGSPPLLEVAQFMAGLMRDPAVNKRFQLKSWEIKPPAGGATDGLQLLNITVLLSERPS